jgi:prefoldin subunit 5
LEIASMTQLILEIKSGVETHGIDATRERFRADVAELKEEIATLRTESGQLVSRASRRDWNRSQQTQWVASERNRIGKLIEGLETEIATLETAIRRYLPETVSV